VKLDSVFVIPLLIISILQEPNSKILVSMAVLNLLLLTKMFVNVYKEHLLLLVLSMELLS